MSEDMFDAIQDYLNTEFSWNEIVDDWDGTVKKLKRFVKERTAQASHNPHQ
ncbi:hypothetical protein LCGC14_1736670 [marine sediment metagenome]|uniref:Uncharacterized protein n=1 Tax=marine sediment metagenome TaxID=412755 RepID=A0A0F9H7T9_9ZZZZ